MDKIEIESTVETTSFGEETSEKRYPEGDENVVTAEVDDGKIVVEAQRNKSCVDETTKHFHNVELTERTLPKGFWAWFGIHAAIAGAGAIALAVGIQKVEEGESRDLGSPEQEKDLDTGKVLVPAGAVAVSAGGLFLIFDLIDMFSAVDREKPLRDSSSMYVSEPRACGQEPASGLAFELRSGGDPAFEKVLSYEFESGEDGRVSIPVLGTSEVERFPYYPEFASLDCDGCEPVGLLLPPLISSELVLMHNDEEELRRWLANHNTYAPNAQKVQAALDAIEKEKKKKAEARSAALEKACDKGERDACEQVDRELEWLEKACRKRDADACYDLGVLWRDGPPDEEADAKKGRKLLDKACRLKNSDACVLLGYAYDLGEQVPKSKKKATAYYKKACKLDDERGCAELAEAKEAKAEAEREAREARKPMVFSDIRPRIDYGDHPWVKFDVTANRGIHKVWIVTRVRCHDGDKLRRAKSFELVTDLEKGETSSHEIVVVDMEVPTGVEWCDFSFALTDNMFRPPGKPIKQVCWRDYSVSDGKCSK
jgi:hypothetical protein